MEKLNQFTQFIKNNIGVLVVILAYLVAVSVFTGGLFTTRLFDDNLSEIGNKTFFWAVIIPIYVLTISFIAQAIFFKIEHRKEIETIENGQNQRLNELKQSSTLFSVLNQFSANDLYTITLYGFLIEKLKKDIELIKDKKYFAETLYWNISNKFIFSQNEAFCTCVLSPHELEDEKLKTYFKEQNEKVQSGAISITRVLIINSSKDLDSYNDFVNLQILHKIKLYVFAKDISKFDEVAWNEYKKDFALAGTKFLISAVITNTGFKGYEIVELKGDTPNFYKKIVEEMKPIKDFKTLFTQESTRIAIEKINYY